MYGEHGRIGLITLATDTSVLPEYQRLMPDDVQVYPAPITLPRGEVTPDALSEMLATNELEQAALKLAWTGVEMIVFACTSGSLVHGVGWDRKLIERMTAASGIASTTTTTAVIEAFTTVRATKLVIATPYLPEVNEIERQFFEDSGFSVIVIDGLRCATDPDIGKLGPEDAKALLATIDDPEADAIFISCTNWHVVEAVSEMERLYGKPVITSNLAGAWSALRATGIIEATELPRNLLIRALDHRGNGT